MENLDNQVSKKFVFWDKEFLKKDNVVGNLTAITLPELINRLYQIDKVAKSGKVAFEELVSLCYNIICRIPLPIVEVDVPYVVRCRPNKPGEDFFTKVSQLSYNPKASQGRFNLECEPLFYAASLTKKENGFPPELCAIFETNKDLKDPNVAISNDRYITLSYWPIKKKFFAIALSFYSLANSNNETMNYMNTFFTNVFSRKFTSSSKKIILFFCNYLSLKASTIYVNETDYYIATAFRHALAQYYEQELKAILYSSSMTENRGLNIAITKDLIDNKDVSFGQTIMYRIDKMKRIEHCTEFVSSNENEEFKFELVT